jgi:large subunit ribosomal protein L6
VLVVKRPTDQQRHRAAHGLYRALIANMVKGASEGFTKKLELIGVGYRATATGQLLELAVGYSHPVVVLLPNEVKVTAVMEKGKNPIVTLESFDKQLLGQVAAKIRGIRKPEPYKGKGIRYTDEFVRRKAGKTAAK